MAELVEAWCLIPRLLLSLVSNFIYNKFISHSLFVWIPPRPLGADSCSLVATEQSYCRVHPVSVLCLRRSDGLLSCSDRHIKPAASALLPIQQRSTRARRALFTLYSKPKIYSKWFYWGQHMGLSLLSFLLLFLLQVTMIVTRLSNISWVISLFATWVISLFAKDKHPACVFDCNWYNMGWDPIIIHYVFLRLD